MTVVQCMAFAETGHLISFVPLRVDGLDAVSCVVVERTWLTNWVENRPERKPQAELKMRQAAEEWIELDHDKASDEKAYLDRWVSDEKVYASEES